MNVLLAAGLSVTEKEVMSILNNRGDHCQRCYHQQAVMAAVNEFDPEVVVLGPALPGDKIILDDIVMPLRELGLRVIFLPGAVDMDDARKWIEKLLPWGVYCYVFDVVTAAKIVDKIDHPGNLGSLPAEIRNTVDGSKNKPQVENAFDAAAEATHKEPWFGIGSILSRVKPDKHRQLAVKEIRIEDPVAMESQLSVYVVFGKHSREVADYLAGKFKVTGYSENLNAINSRELNDRPDVILALGTAVLVEDSNYEQVLYDSVNKLCKTCPNSVIKLIFNDQVRDDIVNNVLSAGNCEVHKINDLSVDVLPALIKVDKGVERVETKKVIPELPVINTPVNVPDVPARPEQRPVKPEQPEQAVKETPKKPEQKPRPKPAAKNKLSLLERFKGNHIIQEPEPRSRSHTNSLVYVSHSVITVWNPTGTNKSVTALNLAVTAAGRGFDVALVELDLTCPLLDRWFKIPQTAVADCGHEVQGAGIMTLGDNLMPGHIARLFCESWGVRYLAAGNKLGNIGTPDLSLENMEQIIRTMYQRDVKGKPAVTIVDAGTSFEWPATFAALKQATVLLVPLDGSPQEVELVEQQLAELKRVGVKPKTVEVLWDVPGMTKVKQICESRLTVMVDTPGYLKAAADYTPYCLSNTGREIWEEVLSKIL